MTGHVHIAAEGGDWLRKPQPMIVKELLERYASGERNFSRVQMDGADFSGLHLEAASFYGASLRAARFDGAQLTFVQFKAANLERASITKAEFNAGDLIGANFRNANLSGSDMTGASLDRAILKDADLSRVQLGSATLSQADLAGANLTRTRLGRSDLSDMDVSRLCDAKELIHLAPSTIDARTVIRSYHHPRLKSFMTDCGVPLIFSEFMIECARATTEGALKALMQSTFISYGGPDEEFARRLYDALRSHQVVVYFFPETARLGERIDGEVFHQLNHHDRVILVCSESSLNRPGVLHELRETFDRESRDGGATYLLPVTIDDYLFTGWRGNEPELAERVARRVVGVYRTAATDPEAFERSLRRLLDALKNTRPISKAGVAALKSE